MQASLVRCGNATSRYLSLGKKARGAVLRYLERLSGYSRAQVQVRSERNGDVIGADRRGAIDGTEIWTNIHQDDVGVVLRRGPICATCQNALRMRNGRYGLLDPRGAGPFVRQEVCEACQCQVAGH